MTQPDHVYKYEVDLSSDTAPARVIRLTGKNKRVLELGTGPGSITRHLKTTNDCTITGLELDEDAIKMVTPYCDQIYRANFNDVTWPQLLPDKDRYDVVIAADVLEHLVDPLTVLKQMKSFLKKDGSVIISVPHIGHSTIHACLLLEDFGYCDWGLLDKTHVRFFGIKNIQDLFENAGLKIVEAEFVVRSPDQTEFSAQWHQIPLLTRKAIEENPFGEVYQVVARAVPIGAEGDAILFMSKSVEPPGVSGMEAIKLALSLYISPKTRRRLRGLLKRMTGK